MKTFSKLVTEGCVTADVNQGNSLALGVTNHLTPVQNIVTNIKNLFCTLPVVVSVGEDGFSIKLNSSKFINKEEINKVLNEPVYQMQSLSSFIMQQGLDLIKMIQVGQYWVVYFSPRDIKTAEPGKEPEKAVWPCAEQFMDEAEMDTFITEADDDEELADLTKQKISEIITNKDKVKAAKQLELLISSEVELPRDYYFAGVKDKQGLESIALRWKYTVKRPKGMTSEVTKSLLNIYDLEEDGVWISDFAEDSMFQLPDEVKKLIETVLEFIGAEKTDDPCVWSLAEKKEDKKKDSDDNKDDKSSNTGNKSDEKKEEPEDVEDDKSRSETDDLLG